MSDWPFFIVTTSNDVRLVAEGSEKIIHEGHGIYYGLTWDQAFVYVMSRDSPTNRGFCQIIAIDPDTFTEACVLSPYVPDGHQMVYQDGFIYATETATNSVIKIQPVTRNFEHINWSGHTHDVNHLNSVFKGLDGFWVGYHNLGKRTGKGSSINLVDFDSKQLLYSKEVGQGIHNIVEAAGKIYVCSSETGTLITLDSSTREVVRTDYVGSWVRGIGITKEYIVLGSTQFAEDREKRLTGNSEVYLLSRDSHEVLDRLVLKDTGSIYDLRVVGEHDAAHNGIDFPGRI